MGSAPLLLFESVARSIWLVEFCWAVVAMDRSYEQSSVECEARFRIVNTNVSSVSKIANNIAY